MNKPPYIVVDEMRTVVENTRLALKAIEPDKWDVLHYRYGYIKELNQILVSYSKTKDNALIKFPLFWVPQPFKIYHGEIGYWGTIKNFRAFIIQETNPKYRAEDRMEKIFKPVIYPIRDQWLLQMKKSKVFKIQAIESLQFSETDRYYWGAEQQSILDDIVDVMEISEFPLTINNNPNCS